MKSVVSSPGLLYRIDRSGIERFPSLINPVEDTHFGVDRGQYYLRIYNLLLYNYHSRAVQLLYTLDNQNDQSAEWLGL